MRKAFLLGAGLGTRLRPLTNSLPKPLIPFQNRPLITHVMDHCLEAGIEDFAINTHHLPETWESFFPDKQYRGASLTFFYEPTLLETGGGLRNVAEWINHEPILVYNGDILTNLPLKNLIADHLASKNVATLALQDHGPILNVNVEGTQIVDLRGTLNQQPGTHQFNGIYATNASLLDLIPKKQKTSIIPAFLDLIKRGQLGAHLITRQSSWLDLGTRESYIEAHTHSTAQISQQARIAQQVTIENSWVSPDCQIESGARIVDSILWPGSQISQDAELTNCIVHTTSPVAGCHLNKNL